MNKPGYFLLILSFILSFVLQVLPALAQEGSHKDNLFNVNVTKFGSTGSATDSATSSPTNPENGVIKTDLNRGQPVFAQAKTFRNWIEKYHNAFALDCSKLNKCEIVEIKGTWDNSNKPLAALGIPHTTISASKLKKYDLTYCKILIVDCAGDLSRECCQIVRDFVSAGGALISTDWALKNTVEVAFPGYIQWNHFKTKAGIVDAHFIGKDPALFQGMVAQGGWCLDIEAEAISITKPESVSVLAVSQELAREEPNHLGILAVAFAFGRGRVLHLIGHYGMSNIFMLMDPAPVIGISMRQALITNFIIAVLERTTRAPN
jgi:hypothetical protein